MNDIIDFLTSKEIMVVYVVMVVACILCLIIYLVDKSRDNRKRKQNTKQLNKLVEDVNAKMHEEALENERLIKNKKVVENIDLENPRKRQSLVERIEDETMQMEVVKDPFTPESLANMGKNYEDHFGKENKNIRENPQVVEEKTSTSTNSYMENPFNVSYIGNKGLEEDMSTLQNEATNSIEQAMNHQINKVSNKIEELTYTEAAPNKEEATRELIKLAEELERVEKAGRNSKIPDMDISKYETEQEENAIISLEELTRKSEKMYAENEVTQYADEGNEPISLEDLERRKKQVVNSEWNSQQSQNMSVVNNTSASITPEQKYEDLSFSSTGVVTQNTPSSHGAYQGGRIITQEVFSPVFGFDNKKKTQEEIDEDLEKTSQFLLSLKELQSKLNS